ncbi:hypothetical protein FRC00_014712 [Tulasnella sp. 408]|nr:hypothetical protein FRC00_014712 [Tulasnella sp. 408]
MHSLSNVKASNASFNPAYRPTAFFVGGTSGVGRGTAQAFAKATKATPRNAQPGLGGFTYVTLLLGNREQGRAHILICGRNRQAAEQVIAGFPTHAESKYEFVECDATLIKNVVQAAAEVKRRISSESDGQAKLNYLMLSQGVLNFKGCDPTSEGLDKKLALHFYGRWKVGSPV